MAEVKVHNLNIVINKIKRIGGGAPQYMRDVVQRVLSDDIWPRWVAHTTLQDHSLEDLRKLGHPYSVKLPTDSFMHPDAEVHEQSGSLAESSSVSVNLLAGNIVGELVCMSPHFVFLRYGTRYMRMRDPGGLALAEALPAIRRRFTVEVKAAVVKIYAG